MPITVLAKEPVEEGALARGRETLTASLDERHALPYTVHVEPEETRRVLEELADEMVWAKTEIVIDSLDRFEGGSESVFTELTHRLMEEAEDGFS